jgi:hypothetical protein
VGFFLGTRANLHVGMTAAGTLHISGTRAKACTARCQQEVCSLLWLGSVQKASMRTQHAHGTRNSTEQSLHCRSGRHAPLCTGEPYTMWMQSCREH